MRLIAATLLAGLLALLALSPAEAHRLRVFATVQQGEISGYAYFVGGARAKGASVVFRTGANRELHRMKADANGAFKWRPDAPQTIRIVVNAGEGHVGRLVIDRARFSGRRSDAGPDGEETTQATAAMGESLSAPDRETIEAAVDAAVERHTRPLMEAFETMETRMRFNDIVGGIGMIVGVAGAAMWGLSRRKGGAA